MFESKLIKEGNEFEKRAKQKALKESNLMEELNTNDDMSYKDDTIQLHNVNENYDFIKKLIDTYGQYFNEEILKIIDATKYKFNTNYNILLASNMDKNAFGDNVIFDNAKPEFFQIITNDLDSIEIIINEIFFNKYDSLVTVDKITDGDLLGFDKNSNKTSEVLVFTFKI